MGNLSFNTNILNALKSTIFSWASEFKFVFKSLLLSLYRIVLAKLEVQTIFWKKNVIFDRKLLILIFFRNSLSKLGNSCHCYIKIDCFGTKTCCQIPKCYYRSLAKVSVPAFYKVSQLQKFQRLINSM